MNTPFALLKFAAIVLAVASAASGAARAAGAPAESATDAPANLSSARAEICLNGLWNFQPAADDQPADDNAWGFIRVPGAWSANGVRSLPGVVSPGQGPLWGRLTGANTDPSWNAVKSAWYLRTITIPPAWNGRRILLRFQRVSVRARVWLDGVDCGDVSWPGGDVDLTAASSPGKTSHLLIKVDAPDVSGYQTRYMGTGAGQNDTVAVALATRGIVDDVTLQSQPLGAHVGDVFVQTSTRKKAMTLQVELDDVAQAGPVAFTARCLDEHGNTEKTFRASADAVAAKTQTLTFSFPWTDPRLWDVGHPNLYTLELAADGAGVHDEYPQTFGFREFWMQGRDYYLNGVPIRFRPISLGFDDRDFNSVEEIDGVIDGYMAGGFDLQEFWPWDDMQLGAPRYLDLWYREADRKGFPLMGALPTMSGLAQRWTEAGVADGWQRSMMDELKRWRNHPSVLMWIHSPNRFGDWQDQNPRYQGQPDKFAAADPPDPIMDAGWDAVKRVKAGDPTRLVATHAGLAGDIQTVNQYPDFTPFQEQEEWLSDWAQHGEAPFLPVEYGAFPSLDFRRGRDTGGWGYGPVGAIHSESETTEFLAEFYGRSAYEQEPDEQRRYNPQRFIKDQEYRRDSTLITTPLVLDLLAREIEAEYLGWRTLGATSGMICVYYPSWFQHGDSQTASAPFVAGRPGVYHDTEPLWKLNYLRPAGGSLQAPLIELMKLNQPTLAWIGGAASPGDIAAFADKAHSFEAGATVQKQVILINDSRAPLPYQYRWTAEIAGNTVGEGSGAGSIDPATNVFKPIRFTARAADGAGKIDGVVRLTATIGEATHEDAFPFRVFAASPPASQAVFLAGASADTAAMLKRLGYAVAPWDGGSTGGLIVVGRGALSSGQVRLASLEPIIRGGGRALIMEQDPDWMRKELGFRVGRSLMRQVFVIDKAHPAVQGLDDADLANWAGTSTLVAAYPEVTAADKSSWGYPRYGWHWGNRATVSSAPIEKPHMSSWRPILECDFDCAYSPLMEMDYGRGRVTLCTLDLEDHAAMDASAQRLARNLIEYARTGALAPKANSVIYAGSDAWAKKLADLGAMVTRRAQIPAEADVLIVDPDGGLDAAAVQQAASAGARVIVLPSRAGTAFLGVTYSAKDDAHGSTRAPAWPECRGISESDLHVRAPHRDWLIASGAEVGADGLVGRRAAGAGSILFTQTDPDRFDADKLTYFRFTRWRQTRALCQLLANAGVTFSSDSEFFSGGQAPGGESRHALYDPDYITDFGLGDDPDRYYRW